MSDIRRSNLIASLSGSRSYRTLGTVPRGQLKPLGPDYATKIIFCRGCDCGTTGAGAARDESNNVYCSLCRVRVTGRAA